jgi:DNA polymerase III delta prime subunit
MPNIIGNILTVKNFLGRHACLSSNSIGLMSDSQINILKENRKYVVPEFQREIRWEFERINVFISDVLKGSKFLGNLILSNRNNDYELIDGQQRLTIIYMILDFVKTNFDGEIPVSQACDFEILSYKQFNLAMSVGFDLNRLSNSDRNKVIESDFLSQNEKYLSIYEIIKKSKLNQKANSKHFLSNLMKSEFNVIVDCSGNYKVGIEYFLDVNTKSMTLDTEDIFKGYLFSEDDDDHSYTCQWAKLKRKSVEFNKKLNETYKSSYDIMKIFEHYLKLKLPSIERYQEIQFDARFELTNDITVEDNKHFKGEHIVSVIANYNFMIDMLHFIDKYMDFCLMIINSVSPSLELKEILVNSDDIEKNVIHLMLRNVLLNPLLVPKIAVMKYFIKLNEEVPSSKETNKIFLELFPLAASFVLFESKKDNQLYEVFSKSNYLELCNEKIRSYIRSNDKYSSIHLKASYLKDDDETSNYLAKTLASLHNFYRWNATKKRLVLRSETEFLKFLTDTSKYSIEHLVINKSGKYINTSTQETIHYFKEITKYKNSMINFIFINEHLNNDLLKNNELKEKIRLLEENINEINCDYSKKMIQTIKECCSDDENNIKSNAELFVDTSSTNKIFDQISEKMSSYINESIYETN